MMEAAMTGAARYVEKHGGERPKVIGVTRLTSMAGAGDVLEEVLRLADEAARAGIDGIVCSPREVAEVKRAFGEKLLAVVPGIRLPDQARNDQARVGTPAQASDDGADFIVVGRSVTASDDPLGMLSRIRKEVMHA